MFVYRHAATTAHNKSEHLTDREYQPMKKLITVFLTASAISSAAFAYDGFAPAGENIWRGVDFSERPETAGMYHHLDTDYTNRRSYNEGRAAVGIRGDGNNVNIEQVGRDNRNNAHVFIGGRQTSVAGQSMDVRDVHGKRPDFDRKFGADGIANNNTVNVKQTGKEQKLFANLLGDDNTLNVNQQGKDQRAFVQLGDKGSNVTIDQQGVGNEASVQMMQGALEAQILQANTGNQAHVIGAEAGGATSTLLIDQRLAQESHAQVYLGSLSSPNGGGNNVSITQHGSAYANIAANGLGNSVTLKQGH
jgi:hypothetical protein